MRSERIEAVTSLILHPFKRELLKSLNNQGLKTVENGRGKFTYEELKLILRTVNPEEISQLLERVSKEGQIEVRKLGGKKGSSRFCSFNSGQMRLFLYRPFFKLPGNIPKEESIRIRTKAILTEVSKGEPIISVIPELVPSPISLAKEPVKERRSSEKIRIRNVEPPEKRRKKPIEKREGAITVIENEEGREEKVEQPLQKKTSTIKVTLAGFNISPKDVERIIGLAEDRESMEIIKRAAHKLSPRFLNLTAHLPIAIITKGTPSHKIGHAKNIIEEAISLGLLKPHGGGRGRTYEITALGFRIVKWYAFQESQKDFGGKP